MLKSGNYLSLLSHYWQLDTVLSADFFMPRLQPQTPNLHPALFPLVIAALLPLPSLCTPLALTHLYTHFTSPTSPTP